MRTAFLIDGGFFLKRYHRLQGSKSPQEAAKALHRMCRDHLLEKRRDWALRPATLKKLLAHKVSLGDLSETDIRYDVRQKGVDMRLGLDVASLAYKKQVDQIVLVAGDSDFVPAAKLARREGIDFILDPLWAPIREDLHEHIDGLRSVLPRPRGQQAPTSAIEGDDGAVADEPS
jgi:uncharacterized LabA/DUF88 family protein